MKQPLPWIFYDNEGRGRFYRWQCPSLRRRRPLPSREFCHARRRKRQHHGRRGGERVPSHGRGSLPLRFWQCSRSRFPNHGLCYGQSKLVRHIGEFAFCVTTITLNGHRWYVLWRYSVYYPGNHENYRKTFLTAVASYWLSTLRGDSAG